jgi:hypothetical protein
VLRGELLAIPEGPSNAAEETNTGHGRRKAKDAFRLPPLPIAAPDQGKKTVRSIFQHLHEILRASAVGQDKQAVAKVIPNHGIRAGLLVT